MGGKFHQKLFSAFLCTDLLLQQPWALQLVKISVQAAGCRWQGCGSSSSLFSHVGHFRKDTLLHGAVCPAQALILGRMSLCLESKLSVCSVYVSTLPGCCLLLGWKCPAKNSSSPCWLCGRPPPASSVTFLPG